MTQIYLSMARAVQQDQPSSIFSSTVPLFLSSCAVTGQAAFKSHSHTKAGSGCSPQVLPRQVALRLLTVRRAAPQGLVTFSIRTLNLLLIIEKAWQAAGEGKFRTLQSTLLPSACLIRLAELSEDWPEM